MKQQNIGIGQKGFTLLEILVVLTIMGFLIAMVAPRLAGISSSAVDTVCDSNQNRMTSMMSGFFEKTNRFPTKLTNLVEETADGEYQIPAVSDNDPANGPETLAREFMTRNHFRVHYLNAAEVAELKNMGITKVFNLNAYDAYTADGSARKANYPPTGDDPNDVAVAASVTKAPKMEEITLDTSLATAFAVAMVGMGSADDTANPIAHTGERNWGEPDWLGRIVFGFGPENSMVSSGIIANAAHCPGGIQNADNVTYNDYNLVLPRLEATSARMWDATSGSLVTNVTDADATTDGIQLNVVAYDDEPAAGYAFGAGENADNLKVRTVTVSNAQEKWQYATQCPEGHMFPADDEEFWGIDLNGGATASLD